jgi:hypothetical protein
VALLQLFSFPWGSLSGKPIICLWETSTLIRLQNGRNKVDDHAEKAAHFFITCQENPDTKAKVTEAVQVKGYFDSKAGCQFDAADADALCNC